MAVVMGNIDLAKRLVKTKDKIFSLPDKTERGADRPYPPLLRTNLLTESHRWQNNAAGFNGSVKHQREWNWWRTLSFFMTPSGSNSLLPRKTIFKRFKNEL